MSAPALEASLQARWKMGLHWLGAPAGAWLAEDIGVLRWVDLNPFGRTHRTPSNAQLQCDSAQNQAQLQTCRAARSPAGGPPDVPLDDVRRADSASTVWSVHCRPEMGRAVYAGADGVVASTQAAGCSTHASVPSGRCVGGQQYANTPACRLRSNPAARADRELMRPCWSCAQALSGDGQALCVLSGEQVAARARCASSAGAMPLDKVRLHM